MPFNFLKSHFAWFQKFSTPFRQKEGYVPEVSREPSHYYKSRLYLQSPLHSPSPPEVLHHQEAAAQAMALHYIRRGRHQPEWLADDLARENSGTYDRGNFPHHIKKMVCCDYLAYHGASPDEVILSQ